MHIAFPWLSLLPPHSEALVGLAPSSQVDLCLSGCVGTSRPHSPHTGHEDGSRLSQWCSASPFLQGPRPCPAPSMVMELTWPAGAV